MDAKTCPLCPLFWLCGSLLPETDLQKANQRAAKAEAENHELRNRMADRGIDAGGSVYIKGQGE